MRISSTKITQNGFVVLGNQILLIGGLTLIRLPRIFGLESNPWLIIIALMPFWYVISMNHLPETIILKKLPRFWSNTLIQIALVVNISGLFILMSAIFIHGFNNRENILFQCMEIVLVCICIFAFLGSLIYFFRILKFNKLLFTTGALFFGLIVIGFYRTSSLYPYLLVQIFKVITLIVFALSARKILLSNHKAYLIHVLQGINVYLAINIVLWLVGIENPVDIYTKNFEAILLSSIGIDFFRVYYPLANSINPFGFVGGAGFVINISLIIEYFRNQKIWNLQLFVSILGLIISTFIMLTTDSRGAILFAIISSLGLLLTNYINKVCFVLMSMVSHLGFFFSNSQFLSNLKFLSRISRTNSDVLSGRGIVWGAAQKFLNDFNVMHIFGYGSSGHEISGVVDEYNFQFQSYINKSNISLHNYLLQTIFDYGYIGIIVSYGFVITLAIKTIKLDSKLEDLGYKSLFVLLIYIILAGSVSVTPTIYSSELFYIIPFIWVALSTKDENTL